MTPALDRVCGGAQTAEPPEEAHPERVEHNNPNPVPHGANATPRAMSVPCAACQPAASAYVYGDMRKAVVAVVALALLSASGAQPSVGLWPPWVTLSSGGAAPVP